MADKVDVTRQQTEQFANVLESQVRGGNLDYKTFRRSLILCKLIGEKFPGYLRPDSIHMQEFRERFVEDIRHKTRQDGRQRAEIFVVDVAAPSEAYDPVLAKVGAGKLLGIREIAGTKDSITLKWDIQTDRKGKQVPAMALLVSPATMIEGIQPKDFANFLNDPNQIALIRANAENHNLEMILRTSTTPKRTPQEIEAVIRGAQQDHLVNSTMPMSATKEQKLLAFQKEVCLTSGLILYKSKGTDLMERQPL